VRHLGEKEKDKREVKIYKNQGRDLFQSQMSHFERVSERKREREELGLYITASTKATYD
jgi:hypothetical protein